MMPARYAAAYLRRSSVSTDSPGDASREAQEAAVRSLCGDDVRLFVDWGISGLTDKRPEYQNLKSAVENDEVASVCAYSLSRLGRNARELLAFVELCREHGVSVRTKVESIDTSSAFGRAILTILAAVAQLEAEQTQERSAAAREARRVRHDAAGVEMPGSLPPYGYLHVRGPDGVYRREPNPDQPIEPILAAYRDAGSVLGACRLLKDRGIPAPRGGTDWATSALTRILEREAPEALPRRTAAGRRTPASAMFAQLLRCAFCGKMLTPNQRRNQYYCSAGPRDSRHTRYVVREQDVMPFIKAEAAMVDVDAGVVTIEGVEAHQTAIEERLERFRNLYLEGDPGVPRARYDAEKVRARHDLDALEAQAAVADVAQEIDWENPPNVVNAALRSMWREVRLDEQMRPVEAVWVRPEFRRD